MKKLMALALLSLTLTQVALGVELPKDRVVDIWSRIPFFRGADLCSYQEAHAETRAQYMDRMVRNAFLLMRSGLHPHEVVRYLEAFNQMYDKNVALSTTGIETTLSSSFIAFTDEFYRNLRPREKRLAFLEPGNVAEASLHEKLDYVAYGTYTLAPDCQGMIQVTLHLVGKEGRVESYEATGKPQYVMSRIASDLFTEVQRTKFPVTLTVSPGKSITVIGGMNGSVDWAADNAQAERSCEALGGRLPTAEELELIDGYGDWSNGVSIGSQIWFIADGMVYAPELRNPSPVRHRNEVNDGPFAYYCVK